MQASNGTCSVATIGTIISGRVPWLQGRIKSVPSLKGLTVLPLVIRQSTAATGRSWETLRPAYPIPTSNKKTFRSDLLYNLLASQRGN